MRGMSSADDDSATTQGRGSSSVARPRCMAEQRRAELKGNEHEPRTHTNSQYVSSANNERMTMNVVAINAGRTARRGDKLEGLLMTLGLVCPTWSVVFISEIDNIQEDLEESEWTTMHGHLVSRHWAGPGSIAMAWVIRASARRTLHSLQWIGRSGRTTWGSRPEGPNNNGTSQTIIGLHAAFGEMLWPSLQDVATLCRTRPRPGPAIIVGDFNVAIAPTHVTHPHEVSPPAHSESHSEARAAIESLAAAIRMRIRVPDR